MKASGISTHRTNTPCGPITPTHGDKKHSEGSTENKLETDVQRCIHFPIKKWKPVGFCHMGAKRNTVQSIHLAPHACIKLCCTIWYIIDREVLGNAGSSEWNISQRMWLFYGVELPHTIASSSSGGPSVSRPALIGRPGTRASSLELALHPTPWSYPLVNRILLLNDMNEAQDCLSTCVPSLSIKSEWFPVLLDIYSNIDTCPVIHKDTVKSKEKHFEIIFLAILYKCRHRRVFCLVQVLHLNCCDESWLFQFIWGWE